MDAAIEVKVYPGKGRAVVATRRISQGNKVERAPVVAIPAEQLGFIKQTDFFPYYFVKPAEYGKVGPVPGYIVFGLSSLCNHSPNPNARIEWSEDHVGPWASLVAVRDIKPGEEVTLFYTNIDEYSDISL